MTESIPEEQRFLFTQDILTLCMEQTQFRDYLPGDTNIYSGERGSLLQLELLPAHLAFVLLIVHP